jgi:hypothetical protein
VQILQIKEVGRDVAKKSQPTILIPLEWFGSYHAMYRCYAPSIMQLRERFRLVAVLRHSEQQPSIDETAKGVFDKVIELDEQTASISAFMDVVAREAPDIIYYPSIGMAAWYVALSNFRLAPIQVMTPGHPATTMSDKIDYMLSEGDLFGEETNYTEKCVHLPLGSVRYILPKTVYDRPVERPMHDGRVRIAIPSSAMKIVPPFLRALKRIEARAPIPVEFHFFPNQTGLSHMLANKDLRRWFPNATIHPRAHYPQYVQWLAACDFVCETFPFGGTNSVIDCFSLGMPVVCWEGMQIHEKSDASMIRRVGLPENLIAHTVDEYVSIALRLMSDGGRELGRHRRHLMNRDIAAEFFGPAPAGLERSFLEAFEKLYELEVGKNERQAQEAA